MKNFLFACTLLFSVLLFSQNKGTIIGTVSDGAMSSEPLLFANVQLKGSDTSYQTNFHGNFEISDINTGDYILLISYVGYETKELSIKVVENKTIKIKAELTPIQISFNDVAGMENSLKEETIVATQAEETLKK